MTDTTDTTGTPRAPRRAARRRGQILGTARRLFSRHGTGPVTTNQIAAEVGISPGNLYYWFSSKREIIRTLFAEWSGQMTIPEDQVRDPGDALRTLWGRATQVRHPDPDYSFFLRELFPLLHSDPVLAQMYRDSYSTRRDELVGIVERLVEAGLLTAPAPPATARDLVSMLWLVTETAQPFAQVTGDRLVDPQRYGRAVLQPLLTRAGRQALGLPERLTDDGQASQPPARTGVAAATAARQPG